MAKLRINGDSSGYVDLEAPNAASSSTLDLDQVPQKNAANTFTETQQITNTTNGAYYKINAPTSGDISSGYLVYQGSTVRGGFYTNPTHGMTHISDNYHTFRNNNANRMIIDSNGYVTTPYQPAFMTHGNQGWQVVTSGSFIPFGGVTFNTSNSYNSTTHRFTAPVAGKYMFITTLYQDNTYDCRLCMTINGSQLSSFGDVVPYGYTRGPTTSGETTLSIQYIANLNLNDFVEVKQRSGYGSARIYTSHSHFGGYLIG